MVMCSTYQLFTFISSDGKISTGGDVLSVYQMSTFILLYRLLTCAAVLSFTSLLSVIRKLLYTSVQLTKKVLELTGPFPCLLSLSGLLQHVLVL